eukprot:12959.XXX_345690_345791_1 [CDS] Oithona nana genome sequencing.
MFLFELPTSNLTTSSFPRAQATINAVHSSSSVS